jgi:hypothetical protein
MATTGFVHIIESPNDFDLLDGRTEGRMLWEAMQLSKIPCCYNLAVSRKVFDFAMADRLRQAHAQFNVWPILHLSMHGNEKGVCLTDGTFLDWSALREGMKPFLDLMPGGGLVCMSTCSGAYGQIIAMDEKSDKPAFWAIVGSKESISWQDSALAFATFYTHFFRGQTLDECVRRMREASGHTGFLHFDGKGTRDWWIEWLRSNPGPRPF